MSKAKTRDGKTTYRWVSRCPSSCDGYYLSKVKPTLLGGCYVTESHDQSKTTPRYVRKLLGQGLAPGQLVRLAEPVVR